MKYPALFLGLLFLGIVLSCQRKEPVPNIALPGLSPFLKNNPEGLDQWLSQLDVDQKLQQLLLLKSNGSEIRAARLGAASGCWITSAAAGDLKRLDQLWEARRPFPPLKITAPNQLPNHIFGQDRALPSLAAVASIGDEHLRHQLEEAYVNQAQALGLSWLSIPGYGLEGGATLLPEPAIADQAKWINQMNEANLMAIAAPFSSLTLLSTDTTRSYQKVLDYHHALVEAGLSGIWFPANQLSAAELGRVQGVFRGQLQFGGLLIVETTEPSQLSSWLEQDVDLLVIEPSMYVSAIKALKKAYRSGVLSEAVLNQKVSKILKARAWAAKKPAPSAGATSRMPALEASVAGATPEEKPTGMAPATYFASKNWPVWKRQSFASSLVLASNPGKRIPLPAGTEEWAVLNLPGSVYDPHFTDVFGHYADYRKVRSWAEAATSDHLIILLDNYLLKAPDLGQLKRIREQAEVIIVNLGHPVNLRQLSRQTVVVQAFGNSGLEKELAAQLLFGGIGADGRLPMTYSPDFLIGQGEKTSPTRLEYGLPQQAGIQPERLVGIDAIVQSAIDKGATPGAQVLVAKEGKVIYHKAFGHHTYDEKQKVRLSDLYDVASVTKIAATTLVAMQQYERGLFDPKDRLREHLSLPNRSRLRNLTLKKLMTHRSGLQPHLPVIPYLLAREPDNDNCTQYFCNAYSSDYAVPVANGFFFSTKHHEHIWKDLQSLRGRRTRYRYSDANFVLTQHVLEALGGHRLDTLAMDSFYMPLGLRFTRFNPKNQYPVTEIVPTELDYRWRHQLVHGFVHDETAALLGGVAGHAGLFSNARDLAVLFQMLLNGGTYGGKQYLKPETINYFTSAGHGNHRGLGFDKPEEEDIKEGGYPEDISESTYGHTGFTGTCVWVDPEQELIYIFLSNRIYPERNNRKLFTEKVRERIHNVIYDALGTFEPEWPELKPRRRSIQDPL